MRKVVGLVPLYDEKLESYWMLPGYMKMLEEEGAIPLMMPLSSDPHLLNYFLDSCDAFLFTGGHDLAPALYGEEAKETLGPLCPARDEMETYLMEEALHRDKAILGICRGFQFLNAHLGGSLYQDLPTEFKSQVNHSMKAPYDRVAHPIHIVEGSLLHRILGKTTMGVNSCHHQGIKDLASPLEVLARAEDGLIEAVCLPDKRFVLGVQWHPEFSYASDEDNRRLISAFVDSI